MMLLGGTSGLPPFVLNLNAEMPQPFYTRYPLQFPEEWDLQHTSVRAQNTPFSHINL